MRFTVVSIVAAALFCASAASAAVTVYDNTLMDSLFIQPSSGATDGSATAIIADDITPAAGHVGEAVTQVTFRVYNSSTSASTFSPTLYFYNSAGSGGGPGTLLALVKLNAVTFDSGDDRSLTYTNSSGLFNLPSGVLWAGVAFSGDTADALNQLALDIFENPTVGSSDNLAFISSGPATNASNPAGDLISYVNDGVTPAANFNFSIQTSAVPEPGTIGLSLFAGALLMRCRRGVR